MGGQRITSAKGASAKTLRRGVPTGGYDTPLTPAEQAGYNTWLKGLPKDLQSTQDYDLQGAYVDNLAADQRGHLSDKRKKPNHTTFSDQSVYSTPQAPGGRWTDGAFWASPTNLKNTPLLALADYMRRVEPGVALVAPIDYTLPAGGLR